MREILFRGKRLADSEWVNGYYYTLDWSQTKQPEISHYIWVIGGISEVVDPETVGQFTGLTDKNGTKIFEGDIIEGHCHSRWRHDVQRCEIAYGRDGFEARHYVQAGGELRYYTYKVLFSKDVAVIGNIHDNPELLGGAEDA